MRLSMDVAGGCSKLNEISTCIGEEKWTNEKVDLHVLETLVSRSELLSFNRKHFYLFAKNGFTKGCIDKVKEMGNVTLVTFEEM